VVSLLKIIAAIILTFIGGIVVASILFPKWFTKPTFAMTSQSGKVYKITEHGEWSVYDIGARRTVTYLRIAYLADSLDDKVEIGADAADLELSVLNEAQDKKYEGISVMAQGCKLPLVCSQFGTLYLRAADGRFVKHVRPTESK
jgi:hypothetical protein